MSPLLASFPPDAPDPIYMKIIWAFVGLILIATIGIELVLKLRKLREKPAEPKEIPQPLVTTKAARFATFDELERVRKEGEENRKLILELERGWRERLEQIARDLAEAGEKRAVAIHNRINDVLAQVSHVGGVVEAVLKKGSR